MLRNSVVRAAWISVAASALVLSGAPCVVAHELDLPGWQLTWQDEFDGTSVDPSKWDVITRRDSYNNEKQYYLPEQAAVADGNLVITATDEPYDGKQYRSARLHSLNQFGPGRFEARIDLPTSQGMWPAFWLHAYGVGIPWPTAGEIDIMENRGSQPTIVSSAYHFQDDGYPYRYVVHSYSTDEGGEPVNFHDGFHIYAAEWEEEVIRFYVDGVLHFTVEEVIPGRTVYETPKNIILNLAVGGNFGGDPDETTVFPQTMLVDYVRVWSAVPEPGTLVLAAMAVVGLFGRTRPAADLPPQPPAGKHTLEHTPRADL